MKNTVVVIVGTINFIAGVAITGVQSESKFQQLDKALKSHDLKLDRCGNYIGVLPANSTLGCK